ncbi:MAG: SRPBCC family protein [Chloroflexota bacterium]
MKHFTHRTLVRAPLEQVAEFHRTTAALRQLTPPPVWVQLHSLEPLAEGSRAEFTLWMGPLPVRWLALHHQVDPLHGFTDIQQRGPYRSWSHRHSFRAVDDCTSEVLDEVSAEPGDHPLWGLVSRLMWLSLPLLFAYRGWATRRAVEGRARRSGAGCAAG